MATCIYAFELDLSTLSDDDIRSQYGDRSRIVFEDPASAKSCVDPPPLNDVVAVLRRLGPTCLSVEEIEFGKVLQQEDLRPDDAARLAKTLKEFPRLTSLVASDWGDMLLQTVSTGDFRRLERLSLECPVESLKVLHFLRNLRSLELCIGASVKQSDLDTLSTEFPSLTSLSIKQVEGGRLDVTKLFRSAAAFEILEELVLEEQRGAGGEVKAVYPKCLRDVLRGCPRLRKLQMLMTFDGAKNFDNPLGPNCRLVDARFRLAFPYDVQVDIARFASQIVEGFEETPLRSLSFESFDSEELQRLHGQFFDCVTRIDGGKPSRVLVEALTSVRWDIDNWNCWKRLRSATSAMKSPRKVILNVREPESATVDALAPVEANHSVEEIVVDFLCVEEDFITKSCFGSQGSNVRTGASDPSSTSSASFFATHVLPHFTGVKILHFDNFKTIDFAPFLSSSSSPDSSSSSLKLPATLRRLISPTTTIKFLPGELERFLRVCGDSLEELRLEFASGIPLEELESLLGLRRLKIGFIQFSAVDYATSGKVNDLDLNKLEGQKILHKRLVSHAFLADLRNKLCELRVLHLFFEIVPIGAEYMANLKNGVSTGYSIRRTANGQLETSTVDWS